MSAFDLRLPLPYDSPTWEASSAEAWYKARKAERPSLPFLIVMKLYLNPRKTTPALNSFFEAVDIARADERDVGYAGEGSDVSGLPIRFLPISHTLAIPHRNRLRRLEGNSTLIPTHRY